MSKMKKNRKRKLKIINFLVFILLLLLISIGSMFLWYTTNIKPVSKSETIVNFVINDGESSKSVLANLEKNNIIRNKTAALIVLKLEKLGSIKKGEYNLDSSMSTKDILITLNNSKSAVVNDTRVTIIEGDWAKDIARKISKTTKLSEKELLAYWNDESVVRRYMEKYPFLTEEIFNKKSRILLEGYLFPNTYNFFIDSSKEAVTEKMLDESLRIYKKYEQDIKSQSLSVHQLYTLASITQYEASKVSDMKLVAGVFYNRLAKGMMLQSSVTVCYAIDKEKDDHWSKCEVNPTFDSPYNTYLHQGLPPGPILNAGEAALDAVLHPTASEYYYFMADVKGDGTVYYSKTYDEHVRYVKKYLK